MRLGIAGLAVGMLTAACSAGGGQHASAGQAPGGGRFGGWTTAAESDVTKVDPYDGTVAARDTVALSSAASGTITRGAAAGATLHPGDLWLYVDEKPVAVMPGAIPMFRDLLAPAVGQPVALEGNDVRQLQEFLRAAGAFAGTVNGKFSTALGQAAAHWRIGHGMSNVPGFAKAELAFLPGSGPWTVSDVTAAVGEAFSGGKVLEVSSGDMAVTVQMDDAPSDGATYVLVPDAGAAGADVPLTPTGGATLTQDGKYALQLTAPAGTGGLTPGTSVVVEQHLVLASHAVAIPVTAVRVDAAGRTYVECRAPGAAARRCPVSLGRSNGTDVAVREGLSAGTQVATTP